MAARKSSLPPGKVEEAVISRWLGQEPLNQESLGQETEPAYPACKFLTYRSRMKPILTRANKPQIYL